MYMFYLVPSVPVPLLQPPTIFSFYHFNMILKLKSCYFLVFFLVLLCLSYDGAGNKGLETKREQMRIKHLTCFLKCPIKIADTFWPYFFGIPYKSLTVIPHAIIVADGLMLLSFHSISYFLRLVSF